MDPVLAETASSTFQRSHSSSNLPEHHSNGFKFAQPARDSDELPRSASYTLLPVIESGAYKLDDSFNADDIVESLRVPRATSEADTSGKFSKLGERQEQVPKLQKANRQKSTVSGWMSKVRGDFERKEYSSGKESTVRSPQPQPIPIKVSPVRSKISQPLVSLDDHSSSRSSSRSPSPSKKLNLDLMDHSPDNYSTPASSISSSSPKLSFASLSMRSGNATPKVGSESPGKGLMRRGTQLLKKSKGIQSGFFDDINVRSANTSNVSLGGISALNINAPPTPACSRPSSRGLKEKMGPSTNQSSHKKDELWAAFSSLDSDYQKFQAKTSALKTNVVRSTLLPFLRNHQSTTNLEPEHLERRVNILGKWWKGLLDMLDMQNGMSGVDRPVILEAITGIMVRSEWRLSPSPFAPLAERTSGVDTPRTESTGSFSSVDVFLAESVHHNVRTLFVRNLNFQMSTIVEKMSLRHAPASLVTFCGKATAYAFFFCPGVADALARVWKTPLETIKRVADEFGLPRRFGASVDSDDIVTAFPPNLQSLGWTSAKTLLGQLRKPANLPVEVAKISWQGTWASRWCGRDSDLFYVFCKHYHILMEEFLPPDTPLIEKARAPAFVLVHSQIVTIIDDTLHRKALAGDGTGPMDVLAGADASAAALPLSPSSNIARLMCENRLIMLVRDLLSEQQPDLDEAQRTFAESFALSLRAAAKKTSLYDHNACFVLCDLIEEALPIYMRYNASNSFHVDCIDWHFWLAACERMLDSENSMTEVRVLSLLYTTWTMLAATPARKAVLCLDWLLSAPIFAKFFTHWCPLVRAYYMRLLCWRICRFDGAASLLDARVLHAVSARLGRVWTIYRHQHATALALNATPPSSIPCHPAPGRRLVIVRNDIQSPAANLFLSFDGILGGAASSRRNSAILTPPASPPKESAVVAKRRWSIMGKMNPFAPDAASARPSSASAPHSSSKKKLEAARLETAEKCRRASASAASTSSAAASASASAAGEKETDADADAERPPHRALSFRFSLDWHPGQLMTAAERHACARGDRHLAAPRLPGAAEGFVRGERAGAVVDGVVEGRGDAGGEGREAGGQYAGRALVEWALVGREFEVFVERRVAEGVPGLREVEVPVLGVEGLKRVG